MRAVTDHGPRDVRVDDVDDPAIEEHTEAIIRVTSRGGTSLPPGVKIVLKP